MIGSEISKKDFILRNTFDFNGYNAPLNLRKEPPNGKKMCY
jgi:hypothetical protein